MYIKLGRIEKVPRLRLSVKFLKSIVFDKCVSKVGSKIYSISKYTYGYTEQDLNELTSTTVLI